MQPIRNIAEKLLCFFACVYSFSAIKIPFMIDNYVNRKTYSFSTYIILLFKVFYTRFEDQLILITINVDCNGVISSL